MRGDTEDGQGAVAAPDTRPIEIGAGLLASLLISAPADPPAEPAPQTVPTGITLPMVISLPAQGRAARDDVGAPVTPTALSWGLPLGAALHPEPRPPSSDGLGLALLPEPPRRWRADTSPAVQRLSSPRWVPPQPTAGPIPVQAPAYPPVEWVGGPAEPRARFGFTADDLAYLGAPPPQADDLGERRRALGPRRDGAGAGDVWVVPRRPGHGVLGPKLGLKLGPLAALVARCKGWLAVVAVVLAVAIPCGAASLMASRPDPPPLPAGTTGSADGSDGGAAPSSASAESGAGQPGVARTERDRVARAASGVLAPGAPSIAAGVTRQAVSRGGATAVPHRSGRASAAASAEIPGASAVAVYPNLTDLPAPTVAPAAPVGGGGTSSTAVPVPSDPVSPVSTATTAAPPASTTAPSPVVDPGATSSKASAG